jgi:hypothetical protein
LKRSTPRTYHTGKTAELQHFYRALPKSGRFFGAVRHAAPSSPATDEPDTDTRRTTVTAQSTSIRRPALLATVLLASLALAPQALASTVTPPDRADGLGGANQTSRIAPVLPPDRADRLGGAATVNPHGTQARYNAQRVPDRIDGIGSSRFTPVAAPTVIVRSAPSGFDWTAAVIGAVAGLGVALVAMAALLTRGRRDVALPS